MPIKVEYTENGAGVVFYHEGTVTGEELIETISKILQDSRFENLKYLIGDRTNCTKFLPDTNHFVTIAALMTRESSRNPGMLVALVSPKTIEFGMSRMYQVLEDSLFNTEVFRDRSSADKWIKEELQIVKGFFVIPYIYLDVA